ncbi:hypothetical protein DFH28DRAFT_888128 [Melampsora americana]|nr:hypothetical protein DFH28DRAFT_888128 [Melampsora americana]
MVLTVLAGVRLYPKLKPGNCKKDQDLHDKIRPYKPATGNGALLGGDMFCFGQRAGYSPTELLGPYRPIPRTRLPHYESFMTRFLKLGSFLGQRFRSFCDQAFITAHEQLKALHVPPMTQQISTDPVGLLDFAGNFAFTWRQFFNKYHLDHDKGDHVFCLWYPIRKSDGEIVGDKGNFFILGGYFLFPEYRLALRLDHGAILEMVWSGKTRIHHTLKCEEDEFTRLGCSSQISHSLAKAAAKIGTSEQYNSKSNCERIVVDVEYVQQHRKFC